MLDLELARIWLGVPKFEKLSPGMIFKLFHILMSF